MKGVLLADWMNEWNKCMVAEGTGIDMDQTSTTAIPAAVRPPAALLALESTSSATGGDGDAGNYRVSCCL